MKIYQKQRASVNATDLSAILTLLVMSSDYLLIKLKFTLNNL